MALGKPIIGMLNGEGANLIKEADCGFVEENYNYEEVAKKINSFASKAKPDLIKKGDHGKNYYFKHFSSLIRKKEILNLVNE